MASRRSWFNPKIWFWIITVLAVLCLSFAAYSAWGWHEINDDKTVTTTGKIVKTQTETDADSTIQVATVQFTDSHGGVHKFVDSCASDKAKVGATIDVDYLNSSPEHSAVSSHSFCSFGQGIGVASVVGILAIVTFLFGTLGVLLALIAWFMRRAAKKTAKMNEESPES